MALKGLQCLLGRETRKNRVCGFQEVCPCLVRRGKTAVQGPLSVPLPGAARGGFNRALFALTRPFKDSGKNMTSYVSPPS